jgi:hypothetical protein
MKRIFIFLVTFASFLLANHPLSAQSQPAYKLPDVFSFEYEPTQTLIHMGKSSDTTEIHLFFTKSGEYAAIRMDKNGKHKHNLFVVVNRDGIFTIFDDHKKSITIGSARKIMSDLSTVTKWIKMDSVMANIRKKADGKRTQSVKTGNTKAVGNYTAEEYMITDSAGHQVSVWCAKVDFSTPLDYLLGSGLGNMIKMMGDQQKGHPLLETLMQPKTLLTEIHGKDAAHGKEISLTTEGIRMVGTTVPTTGYQVNDYSNMTLMEIAQMEMKRESKE